MSADTRLDVASNLPNLVFGICLMFVGAALALDRMHVIEASRVLRFWPLGLVLFGLSLVVQTFRGGAGAGGDGSGKARGAFHAGHVLGIVFVGFLIMQVLGGRTGMGADPRDRISLLAIMSQDQRISAATRFRGGEMTSVMGGCTLDLRQAMLGPGEEATIDVLTLMGGLVLRVPEGWTVDVRAVPVMGGVRDVRASAADRVRDRRRPRAGNVEAEVSDAAPTSPPRVENETPAANGPAPRIVVHGYIMMGGLVIKS